MTTEERVSRLEGAYEQVGDRLNTMSQDISGLRGEMNGLRGEMNALRDAVNNRFFWLFGFMGVMWVTIIMAVLFGN